MNVSWGLSFAHGGIQATEDGFRSHPFFGTAHIGANQGFNRLYDAVIQVPETREMLLRRMRTILDRWWQPPGTPMSERIIERHTGAMTNLMWTEALLDRRKWGNSWNIPRNTRPDDSLTVGVRELVEKFIEPRRRHFYVTHSLTNESRMLGLIRRSGGVGIPEGQAGTVKLEFGEFGLCPTNRAQEYLCLKNPNSFAVDISGWRLEGVVKFTVPAGTVLPAKATLYVSPDVKAFRARASNPRGGQGLFVVGNYRGHLGGSGHVTLKDDKGRTVADDTLQHR
jgi:hypothetical protein